MLGVLGHFESQEEPAVEVPLCCQDVEWAGSSRTVEKTPLWKK